MDTADREPDLPEPLAEHFDASPEAADTWGQLSREDRHALAGWIHQAWFRHGEQTRAEELFEAMRNGPDALAAWSRAQQGLPPGTSTFPGIAF